MRIAWIILLLSACLSLKAQDFEVPVTEGAVPWSGLDANNSSERFQFAIVTDRTGSHRAGVFLDAIHKLNLLQPEFVVSVGDLIEGYTEDESRIAAEWDEFNGFIEKLEMPFFYLPGNHDYTNKVMAREWEKRFGPDYYYFKYQEVLFLCLNTSGNLSRQYSFVKKVLKENEDVRWTLVFMHHPLFTQPYNEDWARIERLLEDRKHTIFAGHNHRYVKYRRNNANYIVLATTGGGSRLRGPRFGEFDHLVWVTMTNEGPVLANLLLEGIWDENIRTEEIKVFMDELRMEEIFRADPIFINTTDPQEFRTRLRITNNADIPVSIAMRFLPNTDYRPEFESKTMTLEPNSVELIDLQVDSPVPVSVDDTRPLRMVAKLHYELPEAGVLEFERSLNIKPAIRYPLRKVEMPVRVDGRLNEWDELRYASNGHLNLVSDPFSHRGETDASFSFDLCYDQKYLYLAASVTDDDLVIDENQNTYEQDGIGFLIDARPRAISSYTTRHAIFSEVMFVGVSPPPDPGGKPIIYEADKLPRGTRIESKRTPGGWNVEVAIPLRYVELTQKKDWENLRVNVFIDDRDSGSEQLTEILWKPDWRKEHTYSGSGMFFRSLSE